MQPSLAPLPWVAVLTGFAAYASVWLGFNQPMLLNPDLQSDDARTILIPFHRYDSDPSLGFAAPL